jgi:TDG/mug DNA glycosylase family protein
LTNIVACGFRVLFVAINPPARGEHPFATPTNAFWQLLHLSGMTQHRYLPAEANRLLEEGLGLVSVVDRATRASSELRPEELREGAQRLAKAVARCRPRMVALLGLTLVPFVLPDANEAGPGLKRAALAGARVFVLPNPSGRNRSYPGLAGKLPWYRRLAKLDARAYSRSSR